MTAKIFSLCKIWEVIISPRFPEVLFVIIIFVLLTLTYIVLLHWQKGCNCCCCWSRRKICYTWVAIKYRLCLFWQLLENESSPDIFRGLSVIKQSCDWRIKLGFLSAQHHEWQLKAWKGILIAIFFTEYYGMYWYTISFVCC